MKRAVGRFLSSAASYAACKMLSLKMPVPRSFHLPSEKANSFARGDWKMVSSASSPSRAVQNASVASMCIFPTCEKSRRLTFLLVKPVINSLSAPVIFIIHILSSPLFAFVACHFGAFVTFVTFFGRRTKGLRTRNSRRPKFGISGRRSKARKLGRSGGKRAR